MLQRCISDSPSSPSNEGRVIGINGYDDVAQSVSSVSSAPRTVTTLVDMDFERDPPPPPIWSESTESSIIVDFELLSTYKYPRFFTRDPTQPLTGCSEIFETRLRLVERMETTLKHVLRNYWKAPVNPNTNGCGSTSATGSVLTEVCDGLHHQQQQQAKQSNPMMTHVSKHKSTKASTSISRSTITAEASFQPSATPINVWSEPSASTMQVRGKTYAKDGIKVESESSIFSVFGVDSFVSDAKGEVGDASLGTRSYLRRWNGACKELGLSHPPFL